MAERFAHAEPITHCGELGGTGDPGACKIGEEQLRTDDPARGIKKFAVEGGGFHVCSEVEIARFEATYPVGTVARTAFALMHSTAAARTDACAMGWGNVSDGRILYRRRKTLRTTGILVDIPCTRAWRACCGICRATARPSWKQFSGKPDHREARGNAMCDWCDAIGLPECSPTRLAEAGCNPFEVQAVTGHSTLKWVGIYTRAANRKRLASSAMEKLRESAGDA